MACLPCAHPAAAPAAACCCLLPAQMASALAHLHRHGVAHMDVKPDNIYLQVRPTRLALADQRTACSPPFTLLHRGARHCAAMLGECLLVSSIPLTSSSLHRPAAPSPPTLQDMPEEEAAPSGGAPPVRYKLGDFGLATRLDRRTPTEFDEGDCRWGRGWGERGLGSGQESRGVVVVGWKGEPRVGGWGRGRRYCYCCR